MSLAALTSTFSFVYPSVPLVHTGVHHPLSVSLLFFFSFHSPFFLPFFPSFFFLCFHKYLFNDYKGQGYVLALGVLVKCGLNEYGIWIWALKKLCIGYQEAQRKASLLITKLNKEKAKISGKSPNFWKLNCTLPSESQIKEIMWEIIKYSKSNENENRTYQNLSDALKGVLRRKFIVLFSSSRKQER